MLMFLVKAGHHVIDSFEIQKVSRLLASYNGYTLLHLQE